MERLGDLMQRLIKIGYNLLITNTLQTYICLTGLVALMVLTTGCDRLKLSASKSANNPRLTTQQAQRTLERWSNGKFKVLGIKEIPEQNSATADFTVEGKSYYDTGRVYNGPGVAVFSFYNDGRLVMTQVTLSQEIMGTFKTNVAVE
ncbi:MAG: hypothetical protein FD167_3381 [bacterium]|nr:MAG: hypothetical protein FD167_3381 [bacterium]